MWIFLLKQEIVYATRIYFQIPMLLKLGFMVFYSHESQSSNSSKRASVSPEQNLSNSDLVDFVENSDGRV